MFCEIWQNPNKKEEFHLFYRVKYDEYDKYYLDYQFTEVNNYLSANEVGQLLGGN